MSKNFVQSRLLRGGLLGAYRLYARAQLWREGPRILINSIPKAGTHLLATELEKFGSLQNSRLHLEIARLKRADEKAPEGFPALDQTRVSRAVATVRNGQFFSAHLAWSRDLAMIMTDAGVKIIVMLRDPRDILVSRLHYVVGLRRHYLHDLLIGLPSDEARYELLIDGYQGAPSFLPLRQRLEGFLPWTRADGVLIVRFEDLIGERGGGSTMAKRETLEQIADHCGLSTDRLDAIVASQTKATSTLRKGKANAWRGELPPAMARRVANECGPLLEAFGYAVD